jgi:hypothetical protein
MIMQDLRMPYFRQNTRVIEQLEAHLLRRMNSRIRELAIVSEDDGLVLRGRVRTYYEKQLAQHAVMEATSEPILSNEIEVDAN